MKQPSTKILHSPTPSGYKRVKAFAILCILIFMELSVHATVVPGKYLTSKYLRYDASAKTYYWEVGYATSGNADFPEVLEFPTRLVYENDKKSYAIREVSIILKEKTKKVIFHSGLTKTFISYERNSPIESIEYLGANTIANIYLKNCKTIKEATLPKTLLWDGFINCTALEKVTFLEGCAEIPSLWFSSCSALKTIVWPSTMKKIGDAAFEYAGLETLTLPEGFNSLGERCFKNSKLVNVVLPNSLTEIPREAFYNCRRLQTVQMSDNVTSIGVSAFDNCAYLTTMNMPLSIETIGNSAFSGCEAWKYEGEMKTPNLKSIGHSVFYNCRSLDCDYTVPHLWDMLPNSIFRVSGFKSLTLSEGNSSEYAKQVYTYEPPVVKKVVLYVCGRLVDEKNAYDIFGDKTVSYDPKSEVLTLTWANIDATKFKASNIISGSGGDLTIRVVGHCTLKAPGTPIMYGHQLGVPGGSNLTIVGDENSILTVETTNEDKGGYSCGIDMYCGNLTIDNCTVVATGGTHGLYTKTGPEEGLTMRGEHALLNLTGTESAMDNVQRLDLDKMLMILEPEGAEFWEGSIWLGKEKQTHVVIGAPRTDDNVEVPEIREEYQTNFSSDLTDQKTGEALNVENVVINNVYYNLPAANNDGFDAKEQCLILNTSMDYYTMNKRIPADATVTADFGSWYNGLIIVVNGKGTIDIDYQTEGGSQLAVKIGEEEAKYYAADMQGRVQVPYDVATPQYVYIYNSQYTGDEKKAPARARAMAGKSWLKIYGMKITPQEPTGIHNIFVDSEGRPVTVYDMNGRKVNNPGKGVYIVNGKKIMKRQ